MSCRTKAKLDLHFTMRGLLPEWWGGWDPRMEELERIIHAGVFLPLRCSFLLLFLFFVLLLFSLLIIMFIVRGFDSQGRYVLLIRVGKVV